MMSFAALEYQGARQRRRRPGQPGPGVPGNEGWPETEVGPDPLGHLLGVTAAGVGAEMQAVDAAAGIDHRLAHPVQFAEQVVFRFSALSAFENAPSCQMDPFRYARVAAHARHGGSLYRSFLERHATGQLLQIVLLGRSLARRRSGLGVGGAGCLARDDGLDLDLATAAIDQSQLVGGGVGEVDDTVGMEGPRSVTRTTTDCRSARW